MSRGFILKGDTMKTVMVGFMLLIVANVYSQSQGSFSDPTYIRESADGDTVMVDSTSAIINGFSVQTIYYRFTDTVVAGTTLYWEAAVEPLRDSIVGYAIVDSLAITSFSAPSGSTFLVWNLTDGAIGVAQRYRLRKSTTSDSLVAVYKGFSEIPRR